MKNIVAHPNGISVPQLQNAADVSKTVSLKDRYNAGLVIELDTVLEAVGITFRLRDSFDGGVTFHDVGDQSEVAVTSVTCASATDIANATNTFTSTAHGLVSGQAVIFRAGTAAPTGLVDETTYYVIRVDANDFRLASSQANAMAGTAVAISTDGTGTQAFYPKHLQIRMIFEDSSDRAQLPLEDIVKVVVDTGAGDSVTVGAVYVASDQL